MKKGEDVGTLEASGPSHLQPGAARRPGLLGAFDWYTAWALPGMGMLSEAYIIFSAGAIKNLQQGLYPTCFNSNANLITDCDSNMILHVSGYIQICGIMAGMLMWGFLGDITGRKWGSRCVATIMLSGCILLTFTPYAQSPYGYFVYFMVAQTWYGFGVGGEYPMASTSAAERANTTPELRAYRGRQVVLVFSNQGMGNFINSFIIVVSMAIFGQTGAQNTLTYVGCRNTLCLMYGIGAFLCLAMVLYRMIFLHESKMFVETKNIETAIAETDDHYKSYFRKQMVTWYYYFWRQLVASVAWICNDFAFYGNKLQQGVFLAILFPTAVPYKQLQWSVLNSFIALTGYYTAAWLVDKPWYGRRKMQNVGFIAMFVFYIIIYGQWSNMGAPATATANGARAMQALYYLSSYFNQFGPNATTWLVAGEIFPTDLRATMHGIAACMGKLGAIISALWISYISDKRKVFLISALWGLFGAVVTWIWLPDTTGLELEEYDRLQRYILEGRFGDYHGEALNPKHLSPWEIYIQKWHVNYDPVKDRQDFEEEVKRLSVVPEARAEMARMHVIEPETFKRLSQQGANA